MSPKLINGRSRVYLLLVVHPTAIHRNSAIASDGIAHVRRAACVVQKGLLLPCSRPVCNLPAAFSSGTDSNLLALICCLP
jgi:hypothetical protein